jgi:hypothetical protein
MTNIHSHTKELLPAQRAALLSVVHARFEHNMHRHPGLAWANVQAKLEAHPVLLQLRGHLQRVDPPLV